MDNDPSVLDERVTAMELGLILRVLGRLKRDGSPLQEGGGLTQTVGVGASGREPCASLSIWAIIEGEIYSSLPLGIATGDRSDGCLHSKSEYTSVNARMSDTSTRMALWGIGTHNAADKSGDRMRYFKS